MKKICLALSLVLLFCAVHAQELSDTTHKRLELYEMSFEQLMNVKIISASKKAEDPFDVPVSSFVIDRVDIEAMGATSVPDALRLCPGVIVREISNGTYDVSLRGGIDGYPAYQYSYNNTSILVMIDNRPVFSNLQGGTYWQNLPVNIHDVERIEVVHGPSSPLYGPNAVSGVINIITKKPKSDKDISAQVNVLGSERINSLSASVFKKHTDRFSSQMGISYEYRRRFDEKFYDPDQEEYVVLDSVLSPIIQETKDVRFPNPELSLTNLIGTINMFYDHSDDVKIHIGSGFNRSTALFPLSSNLAFSYFTNQSQNLIATGTIKNFTFLASHLQGIQGLSGNNERKNYKYSNSDFMLEYDYSFFDEKLNLRPGIGFQSAYASDEEFLLKNSKDGTFNGEGRISNYSASLKADYSLYRTLRIVLSTRYDRFNYPQKGVLSYHAAINYRLKEDHLLRLLAGRSYNGSFLVPTFVNTKSMISPNVQLKLNGNSDLKLLSNTMFELGYRYKFKKNVVFDVAGFIQQFSGFHNLVLHQPEFDKENEIWTYNYFTENLPLKIEQQGITLSAKVDLFNSKIQFKPHVTIQSTMAKHYSPYYNDKGAWDSPTNTIKGHRDSTYSEKGEFTPSIWGGYSFVVRPNKRCSWSFSSYYFTSSILHQANETDLTNGKIIDQKGSEIKSKITFDTHFRYKICNGLSASATIKNITNRNSAEGFGSDLLGRVFLIGLQLTH